ncbi:MAG: glycosyltransferase family 4 protein [Candidatus Nanohaloarchaea archaeon]
MKEIAVLLPRLYTGGVTRVAIEIVNNLEHIEGLSFTIYSNRVGTSWHDKLDSEVRKFSPYPYPDLAFHRPDIRRELKEYDLLMNHNLYLNKFARLIPEVPMLSINHTHHSYNTNLFARKKGFKRKFQRKLNEVGSRELQEADTVVCVSDRIKRRTSDIYKANAGRIYNGGDTKHMEFSKEDEKYIFCPDTTGATIQRLSKKYPMKGLGEGGAEGIDWQSDVSDRKLAQLYKSASFIVSDSWKEGFPLYPIEAAFCGKPCVLREAGGNAEFVEHGETGFIAQNSSEFREYVRQLWENPELRKEMGRKAHNRAKENFTWEKAARQYLTEINDLIGSDFEYPS